MDRLQRSKLVETFSSRQVRKTNLHRQSDQDYRWGMAIPDLNQLKFVCRIEILDLGYNLNVLGYETVSL